MRTIGNLATEQAASRLSDFLYVHGVENQFEPEDDGTFSLWIADDAQVAGAAQVLARFRADPNAAEFSASAQTAETQRRAQLTAEKASRATVADDARVSYERAFQPTPYVTYLIIAISVAVSVLSRLGDDKGSIHFLFMADVHVNGDYVSWSGHLADIRAGQVWRLVTPIFIHFGVIHIFFNMMLTKDLGTFIETRFGGRYLLALVIVTGMLSNLGQYLWAPTVPIFGGMSGVDYALFGFLWMRGKHDPTAGWRLTQNTVLQLVGWFFLCLFNIIPHVANGAHGVGLLAGMAWGWLSAQRFVSR